MKTLKAVFPKAFSALAAVFAISLFSSCDVYYFSHPQPADKENNYEFPATLIGVWQEECDNETVNIDVRHLSFTDRVSRRVVKGYWPKKISDDSLQYLPGSYIAEHAVLYDSLNRPVDTINSFVIQKEHIIELKDDKSLGLRYDFKRDKDTLLIDEVDTLWLDLGRNAFIRKINDRYFALNILSGTMEESRSWWQLIILEKLAADTIVVWTGASKLEQSTYMFYSFKNNYYFDCSLTSSELLKMIRREDFEISNRLTRLKNK